MTSVAFSPDGNTLASAHGRGVVLWDVERESGRPVSRWLSRATMSRAWPSAPTARPCAARYSAGNRWYGTWVDRERIADSTAASSEGLGKSAGLQPRRQDPRRRIRRESRACGTWPGEDGWPTSRCRPPREDVVTRGLQPRRQDPRRGLQGRRPAAGWCCGTSRHARSSVPRSPFPVPEGDVTSVAFSPDGKTLAVGCSGGVLLWDVARREWMGEQPLAVLEASSIAWPSAPTARRSPPGTRWRKRAVELSCGMWFRGGGDRACRRHPLRGRHSNVAFSPDGKVLMAGSGVAAPAEVLWQAQDRKAALEHLGGQVVLWNLAARRTGMMRQRSRTATSHATSGGELPRPGLSRDLRPPARAARPGAGRRTQTRHRRPRRAGGRSAKARAERSRLNSCASKTCRLLLRCVKHGYPIPAKQGR